MGRPPPREGVWDAPEMAKLALVPGWSTGHGSELGVSGGEQDMGSLPPRFLLFGQLWARKAAGLFLVGLSPGRRDVQKSTGRERGRPR